MFLPPGLRAGRVLKIIIMANTKTSNSNQEYATVDTAPGTGGYWTNEITETGKYQEKLFFSVRDMGTSFSATVTVQFQPDGDDDWSDYGTYTSNSREVLEIGTTGNKWRAGVKEGDYTSGKVRFGFDR